MAFTFLPIHLPLRAIPVKKFSSLEESGSESSMQTRYVYVFQREYATVDPALVDLVGTDEATTCVGLVIRNRENGMTSVAHMDSPNVVNTGLEQMLPLIVNNNSDVELDVHLIGGFEDASPNHENNGTIAGSHTKLDGYSFPLCTKIVETLERSQLKFHIQTLFVLRHNTRRDSKGNACPIFSGFVVETSTGSVIPACFDKTSRCPDEIVRRIRVSASFEDPSWEGRLLETYDTQNDQFKIAPCSWSSRQFYIALRLQDLSDLEILNMCSTSPSAEGPDFVDNLRRQIEYVIKHPAWLESFPGREARVFKRRRIAAAGGGRGRGRGRGWTWSRTKTEGAAD
ncbi:protein N-terminal asparagine amidohydrolase isoform X2 [Malania oleifera]|uniref:protein N-terminal asparagine amidohydrolase isoform X2 n=1 Tax=Malania oleifera TaxID=397392 RepID=UPI0025AE21EC|nr:protein N-terminal asparagine amidohydrolase isoform X2 [Malania oleifera]